MKKYILSASLIISCAAQADITKEGIFFLTRSHLSGAIETQSGVNGFVTDPVCEATLGGLKTSLLKEISEDPKGIVKKNFPQGVDYSCKSLVFDTESTIKYSKAGRRTISKFYVTVNVSCVPRDLAEKQLYSFAKNCERSPGPSCFEDSVLQKLKAVRPVATVMKNDEDACMFENIGFSEPYQGQWWE